MGWIETLTEHHEQFVRHSIDVTIVILYKCIMTNEMDFLEIINEEFGARVESNPSYSMRAFARDLEISPSRLSEILNERGGMSSKMAEKIAKQLGLISEEVGYFKALVERKHGRSEKIKKNAITYIQNKYLSNEVKSLSHETFKVISDWYHFAILSVLELDAYDVTPSFISQQLGIEIELVEIALKRLENLELISKGDGNYKINQIKLSTTHEINSFALRKSHKQSLKQAINALDIVPLEKRDITSMTMAIDVKKLPEAKERIKKFRREMSEFLESGSKNSVYNINIQLVPVNIQGEEK